MIFRLSVILNNLKQNNISENLLQRNAIRKKNKVWSYVRPGLSITWKTGFLSSLSLEIRYEEDMLIITVWLSFHDPVPYYLQESGPWSRLPGSRPAVYRPPRRGRRNTTGPGSSFLNITSKRKSIKPTIFF